MAIDPQCAAFFDEQREWMQKLDESIRGNGKPGLNVRVDRCEQYNRSVSKWMWIIAVAVVTALANSVF